MRRVAAQASAHTRKPHGPAKAMQPVPPIGGFPSVNRTAFLRGMARNAGLLKGDAGPNVKLKAPRPTKVRKVISRLGASAASATPGVTATGGAMVRGGKGPGR